MIAFKIGLMVASLSGGAFLIWDYIDTKQDNAVLEATLSSTTEAFGQYATNIEQEVYAYSEAVKVLGERDIAARIERDERFSTIENRNLTKMADRKPNVLVRILSSRTARLLDALGSTGSNPENTDDAPAGTTRPDEPETD